MGPKKKLVQQPTPRLTRSKTRNNVVSPEAPENPFPIEAVPSTSVAVNRYFPAYSVLEHCLNVILFRTANDDAAPRRGGRGIRRPRVSDIETPEIPIEASTPTVTSR